jgi:hypothetical protein
MRLAASIESRTSLSQGRDNALSVVKRVRNRTCRTNGSCGTNELRSLTVLNSCRQRSIKTLTFSSVWKICGQRPSFRKPAPRANDTVGNCPIIRAKPVPAHAANYACGMSNSSISRGLQIASVAIVVLLGVSVGWTAVSGLTMQSIATTGTLLGALIAVVVALRGGRRQRSDKAHDTHRPLLS